MGVGWEEGRSDANDSGCVCGCVCCFSSVMGAWEMHVCDVMQGVMTKEGEERKWMRKRDVRKEKEKSVT